MNILDKISKAKQVGDKLLAILVDPDDVVDISKLASTLVASPPDFIFVGGSEILGNSFDFVVSTLKKLEIAPVVLFPGDWTQISKDADALLLLSLISGRNPEYLIGQHVKASMALKKWGKEIIPTSYLLIDGGRETSVQRISKTQPISQNDIQEICQTALAGEQMGHQLIYLESGSGALKVVHKEIIKSVEKLVNLPLIVGGGIRNLNQALEAWKSGATVVVIGTAFEEGKMVLEEFNTVKKTYIKSVKVK